MIDGISFWLWIGYDDNQKTSMYVFGESALDLLINLESKGCFEDLTIDLTERIKKTGLSREKIASSLKEDESWEDVEDRLNLDQLSTWEIVDLITDEIKPGYSQDKLLEIFPGKETVFDYSWNRFLVDEGQLESQTPLLLETTIITDHDKQELRSRGPEKALADILGTLREIGVSVFDEPAVLYNCLRYTHVGESNKIGFNNAVLFIKAIKE